MDLAKDWVYGFQQRHLGVQPTKQTHRQSGDAVLYKNYWNECAIKRVIAVTEDGRAVVKVRGCLRAEETPGEWSLVGCFVKRRFWFGYRFVDYGTNG